MLIRCPKCGKRSEVEEEPFLGRHLLCPFCSGKFSYAGDATILSICPQCGSSVELSKDKEGIAVNCKQCGCLYVAKHCDLSQIDNSSQEESPQDSPSQDAIGQKAPDITPDKEEPPQDAPPQPPKKEDVAPPEGKSGMLIETKCPNCGTVYEIAESKIGDAEKCDVCGEAFIVKKREKIKILKEKPGASTGGLRIIGPKKQTTPETGNKFKYQSRAKTTFGDKSGTGFVSIKPKKKFCRECGNELNPKAVICPKCGCAVPKNYSPTTYREPVPDHIVGAAFAILLCLPLGAVAMYYVLQSRHKLDNGDYSGAASDSETAGMLAKIAFAVAAVGVGIWILCVAIIGCTTAVQVHEEQRIYEKTMRDIERISKDAEREALRYSNGWY